MRWITREHPKIDRIACPWLIKRFIDTEAEFLFAPPAAVLARAKDRNTSRRNRLGCSRSPSASPDCTPTMRNCCR